MSRCLNTDDLPYGQKYNELQRAFGHITVVRKKGTTNRVIASVEGWHGRADAQDYEKARLEMEGRHSKQAISDLFDQVAGMANGGIVVEGGITKAYDNRFLTRNAKGDDVTYHSGEDKDFPRGFYLNNRPNARMRR